MLLVCGGGAHWAGLSNMHSEASPAGTHLTDHPTPACRDALPLCAICLQPGTGLNIKVVNTSISNATIQLCLADETNSCRKQRGPTVPTVAHDLPPPPPLLLCTPAGRYPTPLPLRSRLPHPPIHILLAAFEDTTFPPAFNIRVPGLGANVCLEACTACALPTTKYSTATRVVASSSCAAPTLANSWRMIKRLVTDGVAFVQFQNLGTGHCITIDNGTVATYCE